MNSISTSISGASARVRLPRGTAVDRSRLDRAWCRQGSNGAGRCCTTKRKNAHNTEFRELVYRWHPWSGLQVCIHDEIERRDGVSFRCGLNASDSERWLEIPAWMFDRSTCAGVRLDTKPRTNLATLATLAALLRDFLNRGSAASDAAVSGVSPLCGDQNRGEVHAKPEQTEVGTPNRAAANRPVRRGCASGKRYTGVVWIAEGDASGIDHPDDPADLRSCCQSPDRLAGGRS